jgi:hypothetical protein
MKVQSKILIVVGGYAAALLIALAVTRAHIVATSGPQWQDMSGMLAFGDTVLFVGVFGLTAVPATSALLFFLRPIRAFWQIAAVVALAIATTGIVALVAYLTTAGAVAAPGWSVLAPLRVLLAPLLGAAFFLSLLFAPTRSGRLAFLAATLIEAVVFLWVAVIWWRPFR